MSLIADSLKKALKEKTFNVSPGINLLKNLGEKSKPQRSDPKEVRRFVVLIVIPASILVYLLVANPFAPKIKLASQAPGVATVPQPPTPAQAPKPSPFPEKKEVKKIPEAPPEEPRPEPVAAKKKTYS